MGPLVSAIVSIKMDSEATEIPPCEVVNQWQLRVISTSINRISRINKIHRIRINGINGINIDSEYSTGERLGPFWTSGLGIQRAWLVITRKGIQGFAPPACTIEVAMPAMPAVLDRFGIPPRWTW